ncbi:MAG: hypothetical protein Q7S37_01970 [bacterium]|nr:hypothetical protein [bacterium]
MLTQLLRRVEGTIIKQYRGIVKVTKNFYKTSNKRIKKVNRKYVQKIVSSSLAIKMVGYVTLFIAMSSSMQVAGGESQIWASNLRFDKTQVIPISLPAKQIDIKIEPIPVPQPVKKVSISRVEVARERAVVPALSAPASNIDVKAYARARSDEMFGVGHWSSLEALWARESGWNYRAYNRYSGACGIPQAMPCSKGGANFRNDPKQQIEWGLRYISGRYGNPSRAWGFWLSRHWY